MDALVGGEVSGVIAAECGAVPRSVAFDVEAVSLVLGSREWVAAGVRGGDCIVETGGEAWGDGKPDPLGSRALRSLDSRDATYRGRRDQGVSFHGR